LKIHNINFFILPANSAPSDSAPIPPTEENIEQQEEEQEEQEGEKDTDETDQPEPITTDADYESQDIIEKPDGNSPPRLADDFYYEAEKIHAKPLTTNGKTFPENTLSL
jgi:hypothetical protein